MHGRLAHSTRPRTGQRHGLRGFGSGCRYEFPSAIYPALHRPTPISFPFSFFIRLRSVRRTVTRPGRCAGVIQILAGRPKPSLGLRALIHCDVLPRPYSHLFAQLGPLHAPGFSRDGRVPPSHQRDVWQVARKSLVHGFYFFSGVGTPATFSCQH